MIADLASGTQAQDPPARTWRARRDEFQTHRTPTTPQDLRWPSHIKRQPAGPASGQIRHRTHPPWSMALRACSTPSVKRDCILVGTRK
jgi:hypothetical protein